MALLMHKRPRYIVIKTRINPSDYHAGKEAYLANKPFNAKQSDAWQQGWLDTHTHNTPSKNHNL